MAMEHRSGEVLAVAILFTILTWVSVSLRVYVRRFMLKSFGVDDWCMLVCFALFNGYLICQYGGVAYGTGRHREDLTDAHAQTALKFWFLCEFFYTLATTVLKVAIGFFLLRVAMEPLHIWIIRIIMICSVVAGTIYCAIVFFQCRPISFWWDLEPTHTGKCLNAALMVNTSYVISVLNSVADWVFGTLPIFIVRKLQMKIRTKAIVCAILGLAAIGSTATIIRMPYLWTVKTLKGDFLYNTTDVAIWTTVEVGTGITAGCMATLRPLLHRFLGHDSTGASVAHSGWPKQRPHGTHDRIPSNGPDGEVMEELVLAPNHTTGPITTITSKSGIRQKESSWLDRSYHDCIEDDVLPTRTHSSTHRIETKLVLGGISRSIEVSTTEERSDEDTAVGHATVREEV